MTTSHKTPAAPGQIELFEGFVPAGERPPKLGLPFQRSVTIDTRRLCAILHVSERTGRRMLERGLFRRYKPEGRNGDWQIDYDSVAEYCDRLRLGMAATARRAPLPPGSKRRRDADLLPFPWTETVFVAGVMERLDCGQIHVLNLIEQGSLSAYQLLAGSTGTKWRIWELSVDRYLERLHGQANSGASARPRTSPR